jgi:hypothetical protein
MALFIVGMPCSLCHKPINAGDDIVGTTHFIASDADPLWRYSDSVMHRGCFDRWEHRETFSRRYRETMTGIYPGDRDYATWPGPPGRNVATNPPPARPPSPPTHFCPQCGAGLTIARQGECSECDWLQYPSDRSQWGTSGSCPTCGFSYRFDGQDCSHCGRRASAARRRAT